ncbi:MAG: hypothetical protein COB53_13450 [Elusimicrobia bacterium]|nr:MAG: hypothetical protein COB53_13450 [Elusimicrobiota bacterium]
MLDGKIISDEGLAQRATPEQFEAQLIARLTLSLSPKFKENARSAAVSLRANLLRTCLAMLGVVVGTASLITMMAVGAGARAQARERIEKLGANLLMLLPDRGKGENGAAPTRLNLEDADALAALSSGGLGLKRVNPVIVLPGVTVARGAASTAARILGTSSQHASMHESQPSIGRYFTPGANKRLEKVCVLGAGVARILFPDPASALGETVKLRGQHFQVVGILPPQGASGTSDLDQQVLIPVRTAMKRLANRKTMSYLEIEMSGPDSENAIRAKVRSVLRHRHKIPEFRGDGFKLRSLSRIQEALSGVAKTLSILLGVVAATSLLVGGIGIMNIMLVSVRERTREIGLRKAMGARKSDVLIQFLLESAAIGLMGGLVGILLGLLTSHFSGNATGWRILIEPHSLLWAAVFSFLTGVLSGFWPAYQASELEPARALRFE